MKDLTFTITHNNHTFFIRNLPESSYCYYILNDKYEASLLFASNTHAFLQYKGLKFSGVVTKRDNWKIELDFHPILHKHYSRYFFDGVRPAKIIPPINRNLSSPSPLLGSSSQDNSIFLFDYLINALPELYSCIENKDQFRLQMYESLSDASIFYENDNGELKNLDEVHEYESDEIDSPCGKSIIEKYTLGGELIDEYKENFIAFHQSELDSKNKEALLTLKNVFKELPELYSVPRSYLYPAFDNYIDENYDNLIAPSIYYDRTDKLEDIGLCILKSYEYSVFTSQMKETIEDIISSLGVSDIIDSDEVYAEFIHRYSVNHIPSDLDFRNSVTFFVNQRVSFYNLSSKFQSLFNSNHIEIEWSDEKIQLFRKYDNKELAVSPEFIAEYEVYKHAIPYFQKNFFRKNSTKYRPVIEKFPDFVSYASSVFDILFKHGILIDTDEKVIYNENGDVQSAYEELEKLINQ